MWPLSDLLSEPDKQRCANSHFIDYFGKNRQRLRTSHLLSSMQVDYKEKTIMPSVPIIRPCTGYFAKSRVNKTRFPNCRVDLFVLLIARRYSHSILWTDDAVPKNCQLQSVSCDRIAGRRKRKEKEAKTATSPKAATVRSQRPGDATAADRFKLL